MDEDTAVAHAINFFLAIDLFEQAKEQISPSISYIKTHPQPTERIRYLAKNYPDANIDSESLIEHNAQIKLQLMELISTNFELFDFYGSVYLGQWHKVTKIDRIDY